MVIQLANTAIAFLFHHLGELPLPGTSLGFENLELEPRVKLVDAPSLFLLLTGILLVVIAKFRNSRSFEITMKLFFRNMNFESTIKESWPIFSGNSWLLVVNFVLNLSLSLYLFYFSIETGSSWAAMTQALFFGTLLFLLAFCSMIFVNFLSGNQKIVQLPSQVSWVLPQFAGLLLLALNTACLLNQEWQDKVFWIIAVILIWVTLQRFYRSLIYLFRQQIEWYYILLYLCTLEIIPLVLLVWFFIN
ncbi:MAG: DUF4271 domain-containing protein [Bacteroidetes bacterium]|nr:DUF4271 domain-containing protein [Bacteroidota bacterium]